MVASIEGRLFVEESGVTCNKHVNIQDRQEVTIDAEFEDTLSRSRPFDGHKNKDINNNNDRKLSEGKSSRIDGHLGVSEKLINKIESCCCHLLSMILLNSCYRSSVGSGLPQSSRNYLSRLAEAECFRDACKKTCSKTTNNKVTLVCLFILMVALTFFIDNTEISRLASANVVKPRGMNRELEKQIVDKILGEGYDKRIRPSATQNNQTGQDAKYDNDAALVTVNTLIRSISKIDDVTMEYSVQLTLREEWYDDRLAFNKIAAYKSYNINSITLTEQERIWKPDLFFRNEKEGHFHKIILPNVLLRINGQGLVLFSIRISLVLACPMDLKYYPLDKQNCTIEMASYGYTEDDLKFKWKDVNPVQTPKDLSLPRFTLETFETDFCTSRTTTGVYSCLRIDLIFKREFSYYLIQIYIPCCMLVIVSWVSFWLDPNAIPARVSLGVTTLLTMATQISGINASLPPVSYTKAIDVWTGVCLTFVFGALLEFALVNYASRSDAHHRMEQARQMDELRAREYELQMAAAIEQQEQQQQQQQLQHQQQHLHQPQQHPNSQAQQFQHNQRTTAGNGPPGATTFPNGYGPSGANYQLQNKMRSGRPESAISGEVGQKAASRLNLKTASAFEYLFMNQAEPDSKNGPSGGFITDALLANSNINNNNNNNNNKLGPNSQQQQQQQKRQCEIFSARPRMFRLLRCGLTRQGPKSAANSKPGFGSKLSVNFVMTWLRKFPSRSKRIDVISRIFFPLMFALFNLVYWTTYLFRDDDIVQP